MADDTTDNARGREGCTRSVLHPDDAEHRIVSVSSGLASSYAWSLWVNRYGAENVTGVFTDVNGEHPDNYRFLAASQYAIGSRLVKVTNGGRTIWDVFEEERFIDFTEIARFERAQPRWAADGWTIAAPLCEAPYKDKRDAEVWLDDIGIKRPLLYDLGFEHANCGGGCVKAGIGQFKRLLVADRWWYVNWWERGEERIRRFLGRDDIAILRDRRGGTTKPLTLRQLREAFEADPQCRLPDDDTEGGCDCFSGSDSDESPLTITRRVA